MASNLGCEKYPQQQRPFGLPGWSGLAGLPQPIATEELLIPETFDESYTGYLKLQSDQGFALTQYCGKRVKRYTYQLTNYPAQNEPV